MVSEFTNSIPPELQRPAPRVTVRKKGTLTPWMVIGRILWVAIAVFGLYTVARVPIYAVVAYRGEVIEGRIESATDPLKKGARYMSYSFEAGGKRHLDTRQIDLERQIISGQKISVLVRTFAGVTYSALLFPDETRLWILLDPFMQALGWNLLGTFLIGLLTWILPWLEKRLCRLGTPVTGRIAHKHIRRSRRGGATYELHYEFQHPALGLKSGRMDVARLEFEQAHVGERVTILCNPRRDDPYSSTIYEYGNFICV